MTSNQTNKQAYMQTQEHRNAQSQKIRNTQSSKHTKSQSTETHNSLQTHNSTPTYKDTIRKAHKYINQQSNAQTNNYTDIPIHKRAIKQTNT